jgi:hypothetical protein
MNNYNQIIVDTRKPGNHSLTYNFKSRAWNVLIPVQTTILSTNISISYRRRPVENIASNLPIDSNLANRPLGPLEHIKSLELICAPVSGANKQECRRNCERALIPPQDYPTSIIIRSQEGLVSRQFVIIVDPTEIIDYDVVIR